MKDAQSGKILYLIGGLVLGLLLMMIVNPMMKYGNVFRRSDNAYCSQRMPIAGSIDQHFIEQMIPHHQGAIDMANLALEKAIHPEIKTLAQEILKAQTNENEEMRLWYENWFGKNVPEFRLERSGGMMSDGGMHMGSKQEIEKLEDASEFDKEFIEQMIPHHQMAIMMARMLQAATDRSEMSKLASNIIESQSKEISHMQDLYEEWY